MLSINLSPNRNDIAKKKRKFQLSLIILIFIISTIIFFLMNRKLNNISDEHHKRIVMLQNSLATMEEKRKAYVKRSQKRDKIIDEYFTQYYVLLKLSMLAKLLKDVLIYKQTILLIDSLIFTKDEIMIKGNITKPSYCDELIGLMKESLPNMQVEIIHSENLKGCNFKAHVKITDIFN